MLNYPAQFKQNVVVTLKDAAQNTVATLSYYGCWPSDMDAISLQSATSDRVKVVLKLMVDGMLVEIGSGNNGAALSNFGLGKISSFLSGAPTQIGSSIASGAGNVLNNALARAF